MIQTEGLHSCLLTDQLSKSAKTSNVAAVVISGHHETCMDTPAAAGHHERGESSDRI